MVKKKIKKSSCWSFFTKSEGNLTRTIGRNHAFWMDYEGFNHPNSTITHKFFWRGISILQLLKLKKSLKMKRFGEETEKFNMSLLRYFGVNECPYIVGLNQKHTIYCRSIQKGHIYYCINSFFNLKDLYLTKL